MDYLLKSSAIVILFYVCYQLFLKRETFFVGNRWFLLSGLLVSVLVPLIVIPIYVEYTPTVIESFAIQNNNSAQTVMVAQPQLENRFDLSQLLTYIYGIGVCFFIGKLVVELISLSVMLKNKSSYKHSIYQYIETDLDLSPFSFFKWIVFNPCHFKENELNLILNHEKVHARQLHSLDILLAQVACTFFWFNPVMWLYKKSIQHNLEFIADQDVHINTENTIIYQNLLLKNSISSHQLAMTNNFYNSIIKKRILMLHKSKSSKINSYKYAIILPLLILFIVNFNTEVIAQTKVTSSENTKIEQNILKYVITKNTKDTQMEVIKEKMAQQEVSLLFTDVKRNESKEIIGIRIIYDSQKNSGEFFVNSDAPITDVVIAFNPSDKLLAIGQSDKSLSQSFDIISDDHGDKKVKTSKSDETVLIYSTDDDDDDETVMVTGKDGTSHEVKKEKNTYVIKSTSVRNSSDSDASAVVKRSKNDTIWIRSDVKNIIWTDVDGKDVEIIAVENGNKNFKFQNSKDQQPYFIMDGKEMTSEEVQKINPEKIESLSVFKGEKAKELYGTKGNNGVIVIVSKKNNTNDFKSSDSSAKNKSNPWQIGTTVEIKTYDKSYNLIDDYSTSIIDKNTPDNSFDEIKKHLKEEGVRFEYSKLKRNKEGLIVSIKIELNTDKGQSKIATFKKDDGISEISMGIKNGNLFLN